MKIINHSSFNTTYPIVITGLMMLAVVGRIMEIFPILQILKPGLLGLILALVCHIKTKRIVSGNLFATTEARLHLLYLITGTMCIPFSVWPGNAFTVWRDMILTNFVLFHAILASLFNRIEFQTIIIFFIMCGTLLSAGALIFSPNIVIETGGVHRLTTGEMYDPNELSMLLVTILPLGLYFCLHHSSNALRITMMASVAVMILTIMQTGSRGGLIGLCAIASCFLFVRTPPVSFMGKLIFLANVAGIIALTSPEATFNRINSIFNGEDYNFQTGGEVENLPGRFQIWQKGIKLLNIETAIVGVGAGQFKSALGKNFGRFFYMTAHNTFLQVGIELGIGGFLLFSAMALVIILNCIKAGRIIRTHCPFSHWASLGSYILLGLIGFITTGMFLSRAFSTLEPILLAFSRGLVWVAHDIAEESRT